MRNRNISKLGVRYHSDKIIDIRPVSVDSLPLIVHLIDGHRMIDHVLFPSFGQVRCFFERRLTCVRIR